MTDTDTRINFDKKRFLSSDLLSRLTMSYGFTNTTMIQNFPIRGKAVYLHIRRRKQLLKDCNSIYTQPYDLSHEGMQLTEEFIAF